MKKKNWIISIFMLVLSICAYGFVSVDKNLSDVYAAAAGATTDVNYLKNEDGDIYEANTSVGSISGTGKYVLGNPNSALTANSKSNYQLVGWKIIYDDQPGKAPQFEDTTGLVDNKKTIELKDADNNVIAATLTYSYLNGYITSGKFELERVFENLTVKPIFDHIYYQVSVPEFYNLTNLGAESNYLTETIGAGDVLYYTDKDDEGVTTYANAYIKFEGSSEYYYYGELYKSGTEYYTMHKTLESSPEDQKVDYTRGAFRNADEVNINLNVYVDESDVFASRNIDLTAVKINNGTTSTDFDVSTTDNYSYEKTNSNNFLRTTNCDIDFTIVSSLQYKNTIEIYYHELYVVDVAVWLDGSDAHSELEDILGTINADTPNTVLSNVSIYNFYSWPDDTTFRFMVKDASQTGASALRINCASSVTSGIYSYYNFASLDGGANTEKSYSNIAGNKTIVVQYSSTLYNIEFKCREYVGVDGDYNLSEMTAGNTLPLISLKRGESIELTENSADGIINWGYEFVGYSIDGVTLINTYPLSVGIDEILPTNKEVYTCYKKIDYTVSLTNYGTNVVNQIDFNIGGKSEVVNSESLNVATTYELSSLIKLNQSIIVVNTSINNGYLVKFSCVAPAVTKLESDYFTEFTLTKEFIEENLSATRVLTVYVYEIPIDYEITYVIDVLTNKDSQQYVMADIGVETISVKGTPNIVSSTIMDFNNNEKAYKIVVSNLRYGDIINLTSLPLLANQDEVYSFKNYYIDETFPISSYYDVNSTKHIHVETVNMNREIKVVYSQPQTSLKLEYNYDYAVTFKSKLENLTRGEMVEKTSEHEYEVANDDVVKITISEISFGYMLGKYKLPNGTDVNFNGTDYIIEYTINVGTNKFYLDFQRYSFRVSFLQNGANFIDGMAGTKVVFDDNGNTDPVDDVTYKDLNVDDLRVSFDKPIGYYVASVKVNNINYSASWIFENNDIRNSVNNKVYNFIPTRDDFAEMLNTVGYDKTNALVILDFEIQYEIYRYEAQLQFGIANSINPSKDSMVQFPTMTLKYEFNGKTIEVAPVEEIGYLSFEGIPYGAVITITHAERDIPNGFSVNGWACGGTLLNQVVQPNMYSLTLDAITLDYAIYSADGSNFNRRLTYTLSYIEYKLAVSYDTSVVFGVNVLVDNVAVNNGKIRIFDVLKVEVPTFNVGDGYRFKEINTLEPEYVEYVYDEESWNSIKTKLYVKDGVGYSLNKDEEYSSAKKYYTISNKTLSETNVYEARFNISDYVLLCDNNREFYVQINVVCETVKYSFATTIKQLDTDGLENVWSLTNKGVGNNAIKVSKLATVTIYINNENYIYDYKYDEDTETYVYELQSGVEPQAEVGDMIQFKVEINSDATNIVDGKEYNLANGLVLKGLTLSAKNISMTRDAKKLNEYISSKFELVSIYLPTVDFTMKTVVNFEIKEKVVTVTSIVDAGQTDFYKDFTMSIDASVGAGYGYTNGSSVSNDNSQVTSAGGNNRLQYLAKARVSAAFKNGTLHEEYFVISGVKVYRGGVEIDATDLVDANWALELRLDEDYQVVYSVKPILNYLNNSPRFEKTYKFDTETMTGVGQTLSVGPESSCDIQLPETLASAVVVEFLVGGVYKKEVVDCTEDAYKVKLSFRGLTQFTWLENVTIENEITLKIKQKSIMVGYDRDLVLTHQVSKIYDGTSAWQSSNIYDFLTLTGEDVNIKYSAIKNNVENHLKLTGFKTFISTNGKDGETKNANENAYYGLYVYNFKFVDGKINRNFILTNSDIFIANYIMIKRKEIGIVGVEVYDKVYDGTDNAELVTVDDVYLKDVLPTDVLVFDPSKLVLKFQDFTVGENKVVLINATSAISGDPTTVANYKINEFKKSGIKIYPYSITTYVSGFGEISLINKRGLTEKDKVDLLPINSVLSIDVIRADSSEYRDIHRYISSLIKGNNEYSVGYELKLLQNGHKVDIDNNLYLMMPEVKNQTGAFFLTGEESGIIDYTIENGMVVVDLQTMDVDVESFFLTQKRILLKSWQIVLIVVCSTLVITAGVLTFVIIRKRKHKEYSVHEKI